MNQGFGNAGAAIAGQIYRSADYPRYIPGVSTALAGCAVNVCLVVLQMAYLARQNAARERIVQNANETAVALDDDSHLGDKSVHYRYVL